VTGQLRVGDFWVRQFITAEQNECHMDGSASSTFTERTGEDLMQTEPRHISILEPTRIQPILTGLPPLVAPISRTTV